MLIWVMYDISDNKLRNRIAISCKEIGLKRVQKSVFYGRTRMSLVTKFRASLNEAINPQKDLVIVVPVTKKGMKKSWTIGMKNIQLPTKSLHTEFL